MQDTETIVIWDTFSSVTPYLAHSQHVKSLLEKLVSEGVDIEGFLEKLKREISEEADPTRKTDGQIFINELQRRLPK